MHAACSYAHTGDAGMAVRYLRVPACRMSLSECTAALAALADMRAAYHAPLWRAVAQRYAAEGALSNALQARPASRQRRTCSCMHAWWRCCWWLMDAFPAEKNGLHVCAMLCAYQLARIHRRIHSLQPTAACMRMRTMCMPCCRHQIRLNQMTRPGPAAALCLIDVGVARHGLPVCLSVCRRWSPAAGCRRWRHWQRRWPLLATTTRASWRPSPPRRSRMPAS